jgi:hypothetical protein
MGKQAAVVTAATTTPVSIQEAMSHCNISDYGEATYLSGLIAQAVRYAERYTGRRFITTKLRASWDRFPQAYPPPEPPIGTEAYDRVQDWFPFALRPPEPPMSKLYSLTYTDTAGVTQTLASTASSTKVQLDMDAEPARIVPAYGTVWPATRLVPRAVQLTYDAGYGASGASVPASIKQAILLLVSHLYENREPVTLDGDPKTIPMTVTALLDSEHYGRLYDGAQC